MMTDEAATNTLAFNSGVAIMDNLPTDQYQRLTQWLEEHKD